MSIFISSKALGAFALIKRLQKFLLLLSLSHFTLLILDLALSLGWPWLGTHFYSIRLRRSLGRWFLVQGPGELFFVVLFVWLLIRRIQVKVIFVLLVVLQDQLQELLCVLICPCEYILVVSAHTATLADPFRTAFQVLHLVPRIQIR